MRFLKRKGVLALLLVVVAALVITACGSSNHKAESQRKQAVAQRADAFGRAQAAVPTPRTENFPLRRTLADMTKREDELNHPWYVYVLGDNGNTLGYYVAKTTPINSCDFLSSTEDVHYDDHGNLITTAPSLDGIFYGGSGSSGACNVWVFEDYTTGAMIQIHDVKYFTADRPLNLTANPITVTGK